MKMHQVKNSIALRLIHKSVFAIGLLLIGTAPALCRTFLMVNNFEQTEAQDTTGQPAANDTIRAAIGNDTLPADAYGQKDLQYIYFQKPHKLSVGSVAFIPGKEIANVPLNNYPAALAGRLVGLTVSQTSGSPFAEGFSYSLRGQAPLVLVDGIARDFTQLTVEEIESVTVLKDAVATAMLGIRGSKGAVLITTKKGEIGRQRISFTAQTAWQRPTDNLISRPLNSFDYATLYNEALLNDGRNIATDGYSDAALQGYKNQSDPFLYPDVNWQDRVLKQNASFSKYNLNISGGNKYARYYVALEHDNQDGLFEESSINKYNTNQTLKSYFVRSNIELNLSNKLSAGLYAMGRISNNNRPGNDGTNNIFSSILTTPNNAYPVYNPDGRYAGKRAFTNNILAQSISSGYSDSYRRDVVADLYIKRTLDDVIKGLWVKGRVAFYSQLAENIVRNKSFAVFEQNGVDASNRPVYLQYGANGAQSGGASVNSVVIQNRSDFEEVSVGYDNNSRKGHGVNVLLLANRDNLATGPQIDYTVQGISGHAGYNYKQKYLVDVTFAASGSNRYPGGRNNRYPFFPAIGLGWNIREEAFMQKITWLNQLKLFGSIGKTGWDNAGYYIYKQTYNNPTYLNVYQYGSTATSAAGGTLENYLAYLDITWEKARKLNLGIQAALLNEKLSFNIEYYWNTYYDIRTQRGNNNPVLGIAYPDENIGRQRYSGLEANLKWQQHRKNSGYFISLNAAAQQSRLSYFAEPVQKYDWMQATGQKVNQPFGYLAQGLYTPQDIAAGNLASIDGYKPQAGDIRYVDLNGDGVINQYDRTAIGGTNPLISFGVSLGFHYKGFDISSLLQGVANRQVYLTGNSYWEFQKNGAYGQAGQAYEHHLNRYSAANPTGTYPRLTTGGGPNNGAVYNQVPSSFWYRNADFLRLRSIELGYTLPSVFTTKIKMESARLFVGGFNLFTLAAADLNDADPENFNGQYPIQKLINVGINIKF